MNRAIEYEYSDGSANRYIITPDSLEYIPVQPHESSTGFYSGGVPKKISITPETYRLIKQTLESALTNEAVHTDKRAKMTGLITVKSKNLRTIVVPGRELDAIDSLLKTILR